LFLGPSRRKLPKSVVHRAFLLFDCFFASFFLFEEAAHTMGGCNCSREEERKLMVGDEEGAFGMWSLGAQLVRLLARVT
jgi:hypothetical protein